MRCPEQQLYGIMEASVPQPSQKGNYPAGMYPPVSLPTDCEDDQGEDMYGTLLTDRKSPNCVYGREVQNLGNTVRAVEPLAHALPRGARKS